MTPKHILVPTDFSTGAARALDLACGLVEKLDATLHLRTAIDITLPTVAVEGARLDMVRSETRTALEALAVPRRSTVKNGTLLVMEGDACDGILAVVAKFGVDMSGWGRTDDVGSHAR